MREAGAYRLSLPTATHKFDSPRRLSRNLGTYNYNKVSEHFIHDRASLALEGIVARLLPPAPCAIVATNKSSQPGQCYFLPVASSEALRPPLV